MVGCRWCVVCHMPYASKCCDICNKKSYSQFHVSYCGVLAMAHLLTELAMEPCMFFFLTGLLES